MKKLLAYGAGTLLFLLQLHAQDGEVWTRIKEVNLPKASCISKTRTVSAGKHISPHTVLPWRTARSRAAAETGHETAGRANCTGGNIRGVDGDWTQLSFSNLVMDPPLPDSLFVKE